MVSDLRHRQAATAAARPTPRRVLWLGPVQSESVLMRSTAASPAAMRWSDGFLGGLRGNGVEYFQIGHEPTRVWPYGPLRVRGGGQDGDRPSQSVGFINLPWLRYRHMSGAYDRAVARAVERFSPDVLVTYNAEPYVRQAARTSVHMGVPWIPILMDGDDRMLDEARGDTWNAMRDAVRGAQGVAFLSHWAFVHAPFPATFHMDGGISPCTVIEEPSEVADPVVLYTGTKGPWGGLTLLLQAWEKVRHPTARLWVCGPGRHDLLSEAASRDARIRDYGLVAEADLQRLTEQASVLVNPRPPSYPSNRLNFPSKILEYLGTGKPIASTRTLSFSPGYEDVLIFAEDESPAGLAAAIDRALAMSPAERRTHMEKVRRFAVAHGDWNRVVGSFLAWAGDPGHAPRSAHG